MFEVLANARTNQTVVFVAPGRAGCGREFEFYNCVKVGGTSKSEGTVTNEYCPDEDNATEFVVTETRVDGGDNWSGSMSGVMPCGSRSIIRDLFLSRCKNVDIRINFTKCGSRQNINNFSQAFIFNNATISDYSIPDLGALNPGEVATITEEIQFSFTDFIEIFPQSWGIVNQAANSYIDVTLCESAQCDNLCFEDCLSVFGLRGGAAPDIMNVDYTIDGGLTWQTHVIDEITTPEDFPGINKLDCSQGNLVLVHNPTGSVEVWVIDYDQFVAGGAWANTHTFTPTAGEATDVSIAGDTMYLAIIGGDLIVTKVVGGTPTTSQPFGGNDVTAVYALSKLCVLVGGTNGGVAYSENQGAAWKDISIPGVTDSVSQAWAFSENEFLAITRTGELYCSGNGGTTWSLLFTFPDFVRDMAFTHRTSGYVITDAGVYRSTDAGNTWVAQPDTFDTTSSGGSSGLDGEPRAMALCKSNTNLVYVGTDSGAMYQGNG